MIGMCRFILKLYPYLRNKDCMNVLYGRLRNAEMKKKLDLVLVAKASTACILYFLMKKLPGLNIRRPLGMRP